MTSMVNTCARCTFEKLGQAGGHQNKTLFMVSKWSNRIQFLVAKMQLCKPWPWSVYLQVDILPFSKFPNVRID